MSLDLFSSVCLSPRYPTWWAISDMYPNPKCMCETLSKLVCHEGLLKIEKFRSKLNPRSFLMSLLCDLSEVEDVYQLASQWPALQEQPDIIFDKIHWKQTQAIQHIRWCIGNMHI